MTEKWKVAIIILTAVNLIVVVFMSWHNKRRPEMIETTDTLYITRDSLIQRVDSFKEVIRDINERFVHDRDIVINQSADSDYLFFTEYLQGQFGDDNDTATQTD